VSSPVVGSSHVVCTSIVHLSDYSSFALISYRRHKCCPCVHRECMHLSFVQYTDKRTMLCSHFTGVAGMGVITSQASCLTIASRGRFKLFFAPKHLGNRAQAVVGLGGGLSRPSHTTQEDRRSNPKRIFFATSASAAT